LTHDFQLPSHLRGKSRTVVLRVDKDKALELTVSRKAKVLADSKESAIKAIRSGQKATAIYSADTEFATEVRATTDPNAEDEGAADMKWLQGE
jgi:predicted house-cleaning NTP pyrophosphatase (Maf/HAM1 superfamily)